MNKKKRISKNDIKTAKRLLKYVTETYKFRFVLVFICILISAVASISVSLSLKFMLDDYIIPLIGQQNPNYTELYQALGVYLPLITTNCAVLGIALTNVQKDYGILQGVVNGFATAAGFTIAIVILAGIREKMAYNDIPESFKGMPIVLITAGLMAIAFCGFSGLL